ncbi:MAG: hypothetical protein ACRD8O_09365, partial [Bryobacteraceae bacterium]
MKNAQKWMVTMLLMSVPVAVLVWAYAAGRISDPIVLAIALLPFGLGCLVGLVALRSVAFLESPEERDRIQASIRKLLDEVSGVAQGDLTARAEVTVDVTGAIADSFNYMIAELRRIIGSVNQSAQTTSSLAN